MPDKSAIQTSFFEHIRDRIPDHVSLVDELADLLQVSNDSAYRRIRGETSCTFEEIQLLASHFNLSLDAFFSHAANLVPFQYTPVTEADFSFVAHMRSIKADLEMIRSFDDSRIIYQANDLLFFHLIEVPEIAAFKQFFWEKTLLDFSTRADQRFSLAALTDEVYQLLSEIRDLYCAIPSTEIYDSEAINYTLRQIEYYHVSGLFENEGDALTLCDKLGEAVSHMERQAQYGRKFRGTKVPEAWRSEVGDNYQVYFNEVMHTDNTVLVQAGGNKFTYLTNNGIDSLRTSSDRFFDATQRAVNVLLRKSTLISGTSEKERRKVFLAYHKRIAATRTSLA